MFGLKIITTTRLCQLEGIERAVAVRHEVQLRTENQEHKEEQAKREREKKERLDKIQNKREGFKNGKPVKVKANGMTGIVRRIWWYVDKSFGYQKEPEFPDEPRIQVRLPSQGQSRKFFEVIDFFPWEVEPLKEEV